MTQAAAFLNSLGRAVSVSVLYQEGHPTLERAVDAAWHELQRLLVVSPEPTFTFLGDHLLFGDLPLLDRRRFEWSERLADAGIQRIQFDASLTRRDFADFLVELAARLAGQGGHAATPGPRTPTGVRCGAVGLRAEMRVTDASMPTATMRFALDAEIDAVSWVHQEASARRRIPLLEVETTVRSLAVAMHANPQVVLPLVALREFDEYTTTHSLNVSVLAMGLAERLGLAGAEVRAYGVAGLLHDIGKTTVPREVLDKPDPLTDTEREMLHRHPAEGASLILRADEDLGLAAIVAYEHHVTTDGGGYPHLPDGWVCHRASRVAQICDVFDALRTTRPYRAAWPMERAVAHLRAGAGVRFDPQFVEPFIAMLAECAPASPALEQ